MIKKVVAIIVLVMIASLPVAGCTIIGKNKGVEITAHEGVTWQSSNGISYKSVNVSIKNNGPDYFTLHSNDFTFYKNSDKVNAVTMSDPAIGSYVDYSLGKDIVKLVKPGSTQVVEFTFSTSTIPSSFPDTLQ